MGKHWSGTVPLKTIVSAAGAVSVLAMAASVVLDAPVHAAAVAGPVDEEIANFYRSRGGAPLWFAPGAGLAAPQLLQLLSTAQADHLNPRRYNLRALERAVADAR